MFNSFLREGKQEGSPATAIEYGLIAALIAVAIITILGTLGDNLVSREEGNQPVVEESTSTN